MKLKIFVLLVLLLFSQLGHADDWLHQAIKVDNPNELAFWVKFGGECPVTKEAVQKIVEGVFIRSRVKPLKAEAIREPGRIYMSVDLFCFKSDPSYDWVAYRIALTFGRFSPSPAILFDRDFGSVGTGGKESISTTIKERVEAAITEYIKANFDL